MPARLNLKEPSFLQSVQDAILFMPMCSDTARI